jgi:signal transduction histidine kinase
VGLGADGSLEVAAAHGTGDFTAASADALRAMLAERRPALHRTARDGRDLLTIPLAVGEVPLFLQLAGAAGTPVGVEQIALARYAGSLATVALRQAGVRESLERADHAKSEVLVAMSHDLRTPLNVLIGYTRLLIEDSYGPCTPDQRAVLTTIEQHALELLSLLSGALDLARIDVERDPRREEFTLAEVLHELCTGSLSHRVANGVRLAWYVDPATPTMRSDRFRVRQILQNLVDNALRFTERGEVAVAAAPHAGGVRLTVSDTGAGIAAGNLPHLFEIFRPGGAAGGRAGTGCGLYLVKRFSESLGGRVAVDSTVGVGTRFTVDLPVAP